jgi:hypothetical protein
MVRLAVGLVVVAVIAAFVGSRQSEGDPSGAESVAVVALILAVLALQWSAFRRLGGGFRSRSF